MWIKQLNEFKYEGCTASVVYIWKEVIITHNNENIEGAGEGGKIEKRWLQAANVGDSSIYLFEESVEGGPVLKLSYDHKVTDLGERDRFEGEGVKAQTRIGGLTVSRALGDIFVKESKLGLSAVPFILDPPFELRDGQIVVVASDGLWDVVSGEGSSTFRSLLIR